MTAQWSADQSTWPAHLRDDAPSQQCGRCKRYTWSPSEFGAECRMTQPDGYPCGGRFEPPGGSAYDRNGYTRRCRRCLSAIARCTCR